MQHTSWTLRAGHGTVAMMKRSWKRRAKYNRRWFLKTVGGPFMAFMVALGWLDTLLNHLQRLATWRAMSVARLAPQVIQPPSGSLTLVVGQSVSLEEALSIQPILGGERIVEPPKES